MTTMGDPLRETRPLRTFDFGKRAIKVCKCDGKVTFTIPFQNIYLFIKGDLAQHQERSCKGDLSITFTIPINGSLSKSLRSLKVYFRAVILLWDINVFK